MINVGFDAQYFPNYVVDFENFLHKCNWVFFSALFLMNMHQFAAGEDGSNPKTTCNF